MKTLPNRVSRMRDSSHVAVGKINATPMNNERREILFKLSSTRDGFVDARSSAGSVSLGCLDWRSIMYSERACQATLLLGSSHLTKGNVASQPGVHIQS
ncbi:hypothetical protein ElyMa_006996400 [Elysia marginata]|uniref:Uncharacterized protein n=1 Tax=Elysia marginata TaxID=1093978 RepID=A0AAV4JS23_9GAST|nr:hypothetical protein ElyMa_006996400 [Elysia marginata]